MNKSILILITLFVSMTQSYAGGGAQNGGSITPSLFKSTIKQVSTFISSEEGRRAFPEVDAKIFAEKVSVLNVEFTREDLFDAGGKPRTCLNDPSTVSIKCDEKILETIDYEKEGAKLFPIGTHEMFNICGLELPRFPGDSRNDLSDRILNYTNFLKLNAWVLNRNPEGQIRNYSDITQLYNSGYLPNTISALVDKRIKMQQTIDGISFNEGYLKIKNLRRASLNNSLPDALHPMVMSIHYRNMTNAVDSFTLNTSEHSLRSGSIISTMDEIDGNEYEANMRQNGSYYIIKISKNIKKIVSGQTLNFNSEQFVLFKDQ